MGFFRVLSFFFIMLLVDHVHMLGERCQDERKVSLFHRSRDSLSSIFIKQSAI